MAAVTMPVGIGAGHANFGSPPMKPLRGKLLSPWSPALSEASTSAPTPLSLGAALPAFPDEIDSDIDSVAEVREDDDVDFADGSMWHVARGRDAPTLTDLFRGLGHVTKLYQRKFGYVDSHNHDEFVKFRDGTSWHVSHGWLEPPTVQSMEKSVAELKSQYNVTFQDDVDTVDDEYVEFADGSKWTVSHGRVPPTLESLEAQLAEIWDLYIDTMHDDADWIMLMFGTFGKKTTTRSKNVQLADGSSWDVVRGRDAPTLCCLEEKLAAVKELFAKFEPESEPIVSKPRLTKLCAAGTYAGMVFSTRRHGLFNAAQFGRATRLSHKANKTDWLLGRNQAPILDRSELLADDEVMKTVEPTKRYNIEPPNGGGRKMRNSVRYQEKLRSQRSLPNAPIFPLLLKAAVQGTHQYQEKVRHAEAERIRERRIRNKDRLMCIDRKRKFRDDPM